MVTQTIRIDIDPEIEAAGIVAKRATTDDLRSFLAPVPDGYETVKPLLPYSIVVSNVQTKLPVAIALRYELGSADRPSAPHNYFFQQLNKLVGLSILSAGKRTVMLPLSMNVSTLVEAPFAIRASAISRMSTEVQGQSELLSIQRDVVISIDAVVFEDGLFVGRNRSRSFERLNGWIAAEKEILAQVIARMAGGAQPNSVTEWLYAIANAPSALEKATPSDVSFDHSSHYKSGFARALAGHLEARGKEFTIDIDKMAKSRVPNLRRAK